MFMVYGLCWWRAYVFGNRHTNYYLMRLQYTPGSQKGLRPVRRPPEAPPRGFLEGGKSGIKRYLHRFSLIFVALKGHRNPMFVRRRQNNCCACNTNWVSYLSDFPFGPWSASTTPRRIGGCTALYLLQCKKMMGGNPLVAIFTFGAAVTLVLETLIHTKGVGGSVISGSHVQSLLLLMK